MLYEVNRKIQFEEMKQKVDFRDNVMTLKAVL